MFKYCVEWHDCNGAGEPESGVVWEGVDRMVALQKKQEGNECWRTITVLTPTKSGWRSALQEQRDRAEEAAYAEAEAEWYEHRCLEEDRREYERRMARANTAEVEVHHTSLGYFVSLTFYDNDGDMDWGFSNYEHPTIRESAADALSGLSDSNRAKAETAIQKLGICWQ